jgi:hypothetical protein
MIAAWDRDQPQHHRQHHPLCRASPATILTRCTRRTAPIHHTRPVIRFWSTSNSAVVIVRRVSISVYRRQRRPCRARWASTGAHTNHGPLAAFLIVFHCRRIQPRRNVGKPAGTGTSPQTIVRRIPGTVIRRLRIVVRAGLGILRPVAVTRMPILQL